MIKWGIVLTRQSSEKVGDVEKQSREIPVRPRGAASTLMTGPGSSSILEGF